jgi:hypothetical protein
MNPLAAVRDRAFDRDDEPEVRREVKEQEAERNAEWRKRHTP